MLGYVSRRRVRVVAGFRCDYIQMLLYTVHGILGMAARLLARPPNGAAKVK